jgi:glycosyltransferase involved in cell wall biosynthesis
MRYPVSLCMIVKNEAAVLERCLKSAAPYIREIIIVDTGSSDGSREIARRFGAKLYDFQWIDDFSAARNESLRYASQPWILHLDADEYLDKSTIAAFSKIQEKQANWGYLVTVRNLHTADDIAGSSDDKQIRLFRCHEKIRFQGIVHEQIGPAIYELGGSIGELPLRIIHTGYQADPAEKAARNLPLLIKEAENKPGAYVYFKLGETYKALKNYELAEDYLLQAADPARGKLSRDIYETLYLRLAQIALEKNHYQAAADYASLSNNYNKNNIISLYVGAVAALYLKAIPEAYARLKNIEKNPDRNILDMDIIKKLLLACKQLKPDLE